jgi:hypothetical protein
MAAITGWIAWVNDDRRRDEVAERRALQNVAVVEQQAVGALAAN